MKRIPQLTPPLAVVALLLLTPAVASTAAVGEAAYATIDELSAEEYLAKGDELAGEQKYAAARRAYSHAVDLIRAEGGLPTQALRRIANSHYFQGRYQSAALALEELAAEAASFGELTIQAWALADAAWIAAVAGDKIDVDRRLARLDRLLTSSHLPTEVRNEIKTKRLEETVLLSARLQP